MSRRTLVLLAVLALALAVLTGIAVQRGFVGAASQQTSLVGGPFQLVDQTGRSVDQRVLKGKWSAVFFGFTYCPEACPTTLFALGEAEKLLGDRAQRFQTVFVSVDPDRDRPAQIAAYLKNEAFPRKVLGLTGTPAQVATAAKAYRVFYQKEGSGEGYNVNHSTITYLMNPQGRFACVLPYGSSPEQLAHKIQAAMSQGPRADSC